MKPSAHTAWPTAQRPVHVLASTLVVGAVVAAAGPSSAETSDEIDAGGAPNVSTRDTLIGDLGGLRPAATSHGLTFDAVAVGDYSIVLDGGAEPRATAARYLTEAGVELDTAAAFGWPGGTLRASYLGFHGDNGNLDCGDIQVYSNIDETPLDAFYSLWYRQDLFDERFAIKLGKMDANEDFAYVDNGDQFLNSSPGFSPTILAFPSYPDPATAIALFAKLPGGTYARAGIYDGSSLNGRRTGTRGPDDFLGDDSDRFSVGEAGLKYTIDDLGGRVGRGLLAPRWRLHPFRRRHGEFQQRRVCGLGPVALRRPELLLRHRRLCPVRPGRRRCERTGLAYRRGHTDHRPDRRSTRRYHRAHGQPRRFLRCAGAGFIEEHETAIEVFHAIQVTGWMALKPDFQYIVNPGGMGLEDAKVVTLRGEIAF